ncbi:MAG: hypothetical protein KC621_27720 [Myxococcales bacterium]|nr:hypothetical protein [Myxococcales bacterium]
MATTLTVELRAHAEVRERLEGLLRPSVHEPGLLLGLLETVASLLQQLAEDPASPAQVGVEVDASPSKVEIRIPRGRIVDTLLFRPG